MVASQERQKIIRGISPEGVVLLKAEISSVKNGILGRLFDPQQGRTLEMALARLEIYGERVLFKRDKKTGEFSISTHNGTAVGRSPTNAQFVLSSISTVAKDGREIKEMYSRVRSGDEFILRLDEEAKVGR